MQYYGSVLLQEQLYVLSSAAADRARAIIDAVWNVMQERMETLRGAVSLDSWSG